MGKSQTSTHKHSIKANTHKTTMKNLIIIASFAAAACAMNVAIDRREASQALHSRVRRGDGFGSNLNKECIKQQCKFEEYMESQEKQDKAKRNGNNWHQDLFQKYYADCYTRVKAAGLHVAPWNFGAACYNDQFAPKREAYYRENM